MEYNGKKTTNRRIKNFIERQIWFGKEVQQPIPETVITAIGKKKE